MAAVLTLCLALGAPAINANAQAPDPAKARAAVVSGVKAYQSSNMSDAVSKLTSALSGGGLGTTDMAKALYYRGLAYRRKKQPAQAIADLTSALWVKNGLTKKERENAEANRTAAYKEAGVRAPPSATAAVNTTPAAKALPISKAPPVKQAAKPATASPAPSGWQTSTNATSSGTQTQRAPAPTSPSSTSSNPLASVGSFISSLVGGGSSSSADNTASVAAAPKAAPQTTGSPGPVSAVSGWNSSTSVSAPTRAPPTKTAALAKPKAAPAKKSLTGRYHVQVASVRSRDQAESVAARIKASYASSIGQRAARVNEKVLGNMGTFYQVHIGPFAKAADTGTLCNTLKQAGYDCFVVKK